MNADPQPRLCSALRSGRQVRAARAMLGWEQADLAKAAGVSVPTIHRMETLGVQRCAAISLIKVQRVFELSGISFPSSDDGESVGFGVQMRLKF